MAAQEATTPPKGETGLSPQLPDRNHLMKLINDFNVHRAGRLGEIEVRDEEETLVFEGVLRIYWGIKKPIVLASGEMGDLSPQRRRRSGNVVAADLSNYSRRWSQSAGKRDAVEPLRTPVSAAAQKAASRMKKKRMSANQEDQLSPMALSGESSDDDSVELMKTTRTASESVVSKSGKKSTLTIDQRRSVSSNARLNRGVVKRSTSSDDQWHAVMKRSTRRNPGNKRMSFHDSGGRQGLAEMFTPPHGSVTNLRASSKQNTTQIVQSLLRKLRSIDEPTRFALFVIKDSTEIRRCRAEEVPMYIRLHLGPNEDLAKLWVMEAEEEEVIVSHEVAQYVNLSTPFLEKLIERFEEEEEREVKKIQKRFAAKRHLLEELIEEKEMAEHGELV